ncbi:MAG: D-lyxose/D-mannose family sugar isomerase [Candidatus Hydrogenedentes bacterium]|nr:D-lyxose/D-mannose family sugar isomerase [Candidatus Hydrogenedentota bacterium]
MRRSEINAAIDRAIRFFEESRFPLPPFAFWTPEEWRAKGPECDAIRDTQIGWDVTDFGSGDFAGTGRTIFTLRNGAARDPRYAKSYAHKAMCLAEGQRSPVHLHKSKMEDIINHGGGNVLIKFWRAAGDDYALSEDPVDVVVDGVNRRLAAGETVRLTPGESVCVTPLTYHQFWAEEGAGLTLSVEVSSVCDDHRDNFWLESGDRFPSIDEDEPARHVLCGEYPPAPKG